MNLADQKTSRDQHLFSQGQKRILSLDGGGVRGVVAIAYLERLEKILSEREGRPVLLGDWFDLIGGTSTGAIIACALALGYRAGDLRDLYKVLGSRVFRRRFWRIPGFRALFDRQDLVQELQQHLGTRTLDSDDLRTGLCVICKRMDTGSSWVVSNIPKSKFWDTPKDKSFVGNRHYPLINIVRASAAAPHFFDPERIQIVAGQPPGLFVDGGLTPHNNPALQLFLVAALPQYGLSWDLDPAKLTIVSIGTGSFRPTMSIRSVRWLGPLGMAIRALTAQISESQQLVGTLMSWLGETRVPWEISSELGDLGQTAPPRGQAFFRYLRYDLQLEKQWLSDNLSVDLPASVVEKYRRLDMPENIPELYRLGTASAEKQMHLDHFDQ